ncbi:MAG: MutL protein [Firmicutes bacterium HGW-Firmicutes-8]|nr:MAG: MutL protein [Firmicutes bacterium HGW-Firmicutes-8]
MELALLIDFGSTYTKVAAVDLDEEIIVGTARAFSTVETNIMEGFSKALRELEHSTGLSSPVYKYKTACSSAAGGLRMVAIGLVPDLTVEAAKRAALGAGARVIDVFAHELTKAEVGKIEQMNPDIILLAGGTDGGNKEVITHNARQLAGSAMLKAPVVVAGNKTAAEDVGAILTGGGKDVRITDNVMPELNVLNIDPTRNAIRELFLQRIVAAKGLKKAEEFIDGVLMPTPTAVLQASELLARGHKGEPGLGDLIVVDVGGATTDVHSLASGEPTKAGVSMKGLPEPFAKRTVEGDLGMRYSAHALLETAGLPRLVKSSGLGETDILNHIANAGSNPEVLSTDGPSRQIDTAVAYVAVNIAVERHVGKIEVLYTPFGASYIQTGKDLTQVNFLIGTGGVIVYHENPLVIMKGALFDENRPTVLKPMKPKVLIDREYILAAMGLLAEVNPLTSLRIMKKYLAEIV